MKIVYLAAGAAGFYCGACARDVALARGLIARGHDCLLLPLYTPLRADSPDPSFPRVFYGGISAWLEQKSALFRRRLPLLDALLRAPWLLRTVSRFAIETRPEDLGDMTVSVLRGLSGRQAKELRRLVRFLQDDVRPDLVNLTNSLLSAVVRPLKDRLAVPVVCTLQGEEAFVARLPQPYRDQAAELLRRHAADVDLFIAPADSYADEMARFLAVPRQRFRVVRPGVDLRLYRPPGRPQPAAPRIGCLSRISPAKGTDILCDAFAIVHSRRGEEAALALAGQLAAADRPWWTDVRRRFADRGLAGRLDFRGEVALPDKVAFLQGLTLFAQPSRFPERRAVAAIEALATGVPIIVPRSGAFTEIVELTDAGVLVESESAPSLADALARLLDDPAERARLARAARAGAESFFSADAMTDATLRAYDELLAPSRAR